MKVFKTVREAAIAALREVMPLSKRKGYEYGGFILSSEGGYTYTKAVTDNSDGNVNLDEDRFTIPRGFVKVSDYHTHPCRPAGYGGKGAGYFDQFFSPTDMQSLLLNNFETTYMAPTCSGKVYEASPSLPVVWPAKEDGPAAALGPVIGQV